MVLFSKIRNSPISFVELLDLPTNMYKYVITVIGETSAPTQFIQGKNFNIIQALFFLKAIGFPIKVNTFALEKIFQS